MPVKLSHSLAGIERIAFHFGELLFGDLVALALIAGIYKLGGLPTKSAYRRSSPRRSFITPVRTSLICRTSAATRA
jgi:hypothetical protein